MANEGQWGECPNCNAPLVTRSSRVSGSGSRRERYRMHACKAGCSYTTSTVQVDHARWQQIQQTLKITGPANVPAEERKAGVAYKMTDGEIELARAQRTAHSPAPAPQGEPCPMCNTPMLEVEHGDETGWQCVNPECQ